MNSKLLLSAITLGGVLATSAFATPTNAHAVVAQGLNLAAPAVERCVSPTGLLRRYDGANVVLSLTVDAAGRPHNIRILSHDDPGLSAKLLPAVAQWQFKPAMKGGMPVATDVVLPIQLVDGLGS